MNELEQYHKDAYRLFSGYRAKYSSIGKADKNFKRVHELFS